MITSSGVICDFCEKYILIKTFKNVEGYHICQDCEKIAKKMIKEKGVINTKELWEKINK